MITAAVLVFTAVNWSRLGATFQGLALLVVTSVAASGAAVTARRRMPVTAEALGLPIATATGTLPSVPPPPSPCSTSR